MPGNALGCESREESWHPLALIHLANAAAQLPYGSGEMKGEGVEAWHPLGVPLHFLLLDGG